MWIIPVVLVVLAVTGLTALMMLRRLSALGGPSDSIEHDVASETIADVLSRGSEFDRPVGF